MDFDVKSWLQNHKGEATLLGICPMSKEIVRAAFQEAAEENFVPMFVATPRQVDADRGYTGWSQEELIKLLNSTSEEFGYDGPHIVARDHGGPYQSRRDRGDLNVDLEGAMKYAKELYAQDMREGFDILHIDATEDPKIDGIMDLEKVTRRTCELITYIEDLGEKENHPEIFYEVGTEEITGGMTEPDDFEGFIKLLTQKLKKLGYEGAISKIVFIVGQVGTTMRIDMNNNFNPDQAEELLDIASSHNLFLKVHYTDWLDNSNLQKFPRLGIGAANVGPEFAATIVKGLEELEGRERRAIEDEKAEPSNIMETIEAATVKRAPWKKFAPRDFEGEELKKFVRESRRNIAVCVGRYVMNEGEVVEAREKLYDNLKKYSSVEDPHQFVIDKVQESIHRYVKAFNLEA